MVRCLMWGLFCIYLSILTGDEVEGKAQGVQSVEVEFDIFGENAFLTYNDTWRSKAQITYVQKRRIVAYKDIEHGRCLLEKITHHDRPRRVKRTREKEYFTKSFYLSSTPLETDKVEEIAGKRVSALCRNYPTLWLTQISDESVRFTGNNMKRTKRESDDGDNERKAHQKISMKLLDDLINAEYLAAHGLQGGRGVKRDADGRIENVNGYHPSTSAKAGQPAGVDYHAQIRNNLHPDVHGGHPIDITSSVTITTGSAHPVWSYAPSAGSRYASTVPHKNGTTDAHLPGISQHPPYGHQNASHAAQPHYGHQSPQYPPSSAGHQHSPHDRYPPSSSSAHYAPSASSKTHLHQNGTTGGGSYSTGRPGHYVPSGGGMHPHHVHGQVHHQPHLQPSSTGGTHHSPYHNMANGSHSFQPQHHGTLYSRDRVGSVYAPQYPPSSTSKVHHPQGPPYGSHAGGRVAGPSPIHYPPSSMSKTHQVSPHLDQSGNAQTVAQYPPSSRSKIYPSTEHSSGGGHHFSSPGSSHIPPSSASNLHYSPGSRTQGKLPGHTDLTGSHPTHGTLRGTGSYPPSSTSKLHYSPEPSPSAGTHHDTYYPPSSASKTVIHPSGSGHDTSSAGHSSAPHPHSSSYPPSSTSHLHYSPTHHPSGHSGAHSVGYNPPVHYPTSTARPHHSPPPAVQYGAQSGGQIQHRIPPAEDRNPPGYYPPSSTSKTHQHISSSHSGTSHHNPPQQYYPPSSFSKEIPHNVPHPQSSHHPQYQNGQETPAYYPPSSSPKLNQMPQNFSSQAQPSSGQTPTGFYPPSSTGKVLPVQSNAHSSKQFPGQITATTRVTVTRGQSSYYPPSSSAKSTPTPTSVHVQSGQGHGFGHGSQQPSYFGPSSSSHHGTNGSHVPAAVPKYSPSSSGHDPRTPPQSYPPSSTSKLHPSPPQKGAEHGFGVTHDRGPQSLRPVAHHPSASGGHKHISTTYTHHNGSAVGFPPSASHTGSHLTPAGYSPHSGGGYIQQYAPPSTAAHNTQGSQQTLTAQGSPSLQVSQARPCTSPGSLYSITTRTIVTPNGIIHNPVALKNNGESPCGDASAPRAVAYNGRYAPCAPSIRAGGGQQTRAPCNANLANGYSRKFQRSIIPGPAYVSGKRSQQDSAPKDVFDDGVIVTNVGESQAELFDSIGYPISDPRMHYSKLQSEPSGKVNATGEGTGPEEREATAPEFAEETAKMERDVEVFEDFAGRQKLPKPLKYEQGSASEGDTKTDEEDQTVEEEVKEGDVLEPGDRILGKDGYTISDGFRGRVLSVTGQVAKSRASETRSKSADKKTNFGQFKYSSELGKYVKDSEKRTGRSDCSDEVSFTCTEFLGSNGRAKICKPNPRKKPDGTPC